jgi:hypothetical protein
MLPVDEVRIDPVKINNIGLGKSIYTKEQLEEFARFQDSQGTWKAYLAETAEMAYTGRNEKGEWGLALGLVAQGSLIDLVGVSFFPLYKVVGPMIFFLSFLLLIWGGLRLIITIFLRVIVIARYKGCGIWVLTAFWGTLFQLAVSPFNWIDAAMEDVGVRVGQMMETEAAREPEEREQEHRRSAEEVLVVAEQPREGGVNRPPPEFRRRGRGQCKLEARKGHKGVDVKVTMTSRGKCSGLYEVGVVMSS